MTQNKTKVFGIGFQKTGTTSLAVGLYTLGYNVTGYFGVHDPQIATKVYDYAYDLADRFDGAQDTPWPMIYKELDQRYPNSKFILTLRQSDKWVKSVVKHFKSQNIPAHTWIYGVRTAAGNEDVYVRRYEQHNREVIEYFRDRPNDLLVMDITTGDGWEKLCPFLGVEIPAVRFPAQNQATARSSGLMERGARFVVRKILSDSTMRRFGPPTRGVSAEFLRDLLHYNYAMFADIWAGVNQLSDAQFVQPPPYSANSIRDYLMRQVLEESCWLMRLKGQPSTDLTWDAASFQTKHAVYKRWDTTRLLLREYLAFLNDEGAGQRIPNSNEYVWEVLVHLADFGAEQRANLRRALQDFDIQVTDQTLLHFYRKHA